jgi:hypothetical protein
MKERSSARIWEPEHGYASSILRIGCAVLALGTTVLGRDVAPALAGNNAGPVINVGSFNDVVLVLMTDFHNQYVPPACNTSGGFAFDTRSQGGRNKLAIALAAKNSGHHLGIVGTGTCDVHPDAESVSYLWEGIP